MILFINTAQENKIIVFLLKRKKILIKEEIKTQVRGELLLGAVDRLLKKKKLSLKKIKGVVVVSGPGRFTVLRTGIMVANTLGFSLAVPVVGVKLTEFKNLVELARKGSWKLAQAKPGRFVLPAYGKEPHIG